MINKILSNFKGSKFKTLIAIGTTLSPVIFLVLSYNYYLGYSSYFGIPRYFINIGQTEGIQAVTVTFVFLIATTLIYLPIYYITEEILEFVIVKPIKSLVRIFEKTFLKLWLKKLIKKSQRLLGYGLLYTIIFYILFLFSLALSIPQEVGKSAAQSQNSFTMVTVNSIHYLALLKYNNTLVITNFDDGTNSINRKYSVINMDEKGIVYSEVEIDKLFIK